MNNTRKQDREFQATGGGAPPQSLFEESGPFDVEDFGPQPAPIWPVALAALVAGFVFASGVILMVLPLLKSPKQEQRIESAAPAPIPDNASLQAPVSILPPVPDGVTVLVKQPDQPGAIAQNEQAAEAGAVEPTAPAASGSQVANGYAIDLGAADSFSELSRRFAAIADANQEVPFDRLEPRATLQETAAGLEARLVVGPFTSLDAAQSACASIALPGGVECKAGRFEGELIARQ